MSKQLVTAEVVRELKSNGKNTITYDPKRCIVTPEAVEVAKELGVEIILTSSNQTQSTPLREASSPKKTDNCLSEKDFCLIKEAVVQKMPKGSKISDQLLAQLVEKAVKEGKGTNQSISSHLVDKCCTTLKSGIKLVKGSLAETSLFEGAGKNNNVSIADVITEKDNSSMSAGYMSWEKGIFPWTLNYDEIQVVLEGELHITSQGETVVGKPGDIIFVPKSSSIEFSTPTKVKFVYIAWPANWQAQ